MRPADGEHGLRGDVAPVARQFVELFKGYGAVVCPQAVALCPSGIGVTLGHWCDTRAAVCRSGSGVSLKSWQLCFDGSLSLPFRFLRPMTRSTFGYVAQPLSCVSSRLIVSAFAKLVAISAIGSAFMPVVMDYGNRVWLSAVSR